MGSRPPREGAVVRPLRKALRVSVAVYTAKRDHSNLKNNTTCDAAFCQYYLTTCCYYYRATHMYSGIVQYTGGSVKLRPSVRPSQPCIVGLTLNHHYHHALIVKLVLYSYTKSLRKQIPRHQIHEKSCNIQPVF